MRGENEAPRIRLVGTRLAPPLEMARWLLELRGITYNEKAHAPIFHAFVSRKHKAIIEIPLALTPEGNWAGVKAFLAGLDEISRDGEKVLGETDAERQEMDEAINLFYDKLFWPAVRTYFNFMLPSKKTVLKYALDRAPGWQKVVVSLLFPLWRKVMFAGMKLKEFDPKAGLKDIEEVFEFMEGKTSAERPFLGGKSPNTADIMFACLSVPIVLPDKFPSPLAQLDELPDDFRKQVETLRARKGGKLVNRIYDERPEDQAPMELPSKRRGLLQLLLSPGLLVSVARKLGKFKPIFSIGKRTFVLSWRHVTDVLERDADFIIEPVNLKKVNDANGPFILGMDRSPELFAQREAIYGALRAADKQPVVEILKTEPTRLLADARERYGKIDVVNGYSRLVAARVSASLFGVSGPTEHDMMRVLRAIFHEIFLNLGDDAEINKRGIAAGKELGSWIDAEVKKRRANDDLGDDVLAHLIRLQPELDLPPESIHWMLAGQMVGSVDTTATSVANIMAVLVKDRKSLAAATSDVEDQEKMVGWCYEALRFRPHNPLVLREASSDVSVGDKKIAAGSPVIALTIAAMHDSTAFPQPRKIDPNRPRDRYLHFGHGAHTCVGRDLNAMQIPALVSALLKYGATKDSPLRSRGPFPDELIVKLED